MPRILTLTIQVQEDICRRVRAGVPQTHAAAASGIQKRTLTRWKSLGREQEEGVYRDFLDALEQAHGDWVTSMAEVVTTSARTGDWKAAAWGLSRRVDEYRDKRAVEHSGAVGVVEDRGLSDLDARKMRAKVLGLTLDQLDASEGKFGLR